MSDSEAGPSGAKRPKRVLKPTFKKYLTEEELETMLYESNDELEDPKFIDQVDVADSSSSDCSEEDYLDDSTIASLPSPPTPTNLDDAREDTTASIRLPPPNINWKENVNLLTFPFTRVNQLLVPDPGK